AGVTAVWVGDIERHYGRPVGGECHRDRLPVPDPKSLERVAGDLLDHLPRHMPGLAQPGGTVVFRLVLHIAAGNGVFPRTLGGRSGRHDRRNSQRRWQLPCPLSHAASPSILGSTAALNSLRLATVSSWLSSPPWPIIKRCPKPPTWS